MNFIFLSHQWIEFWRSKGKSTNLASKIVLGFLMIYFLVVAIILGISLPELINKFSPGSDVIQIFNGFIFYYFIIELASRIQLQELPTISIVPYLHLKIKKSQIVNFLNIRSFINFFNAVPIILTLPFIIRIILPQYGVLGAIALIIAIISLSVFNNYLVLFIKRKSINNILYFASLLAFISLIIALDYFNLISFRKLGILFDYLVNMPYLTLIFVALAWIMFSINKRYLLNNLYIESLSEKKEIKKSANYSFLDRFGKAGLLAALELKLILRHKRSKSAITMSAFFLFYGLIFYKHEYLEADKFITMIFSAVFVTGISILIYGQFMFAWQSSHFDGLLSLKMNFEDFIKGKYLLFNLSSTLIFAISTFYAFISWKLILLHFVTYLFNIGVSSTTVLYFALYNYKKLDLEKGASFNYQGVGATQYILMIPIIVLPYLIYWPFNAANMPYAGLITIGLIGLIAFSLQPLFVKYISKKLETKKYKIAQGFRE
ncbi:DUF5687 family protein [Pedobacter flavus]|uniref:DUF5687 family protein n=1 Tax=Pedobacter flavus TaxID=3113906 RepID=A0ABU7GYV7_9SPHI|nr:DUF5687 family protein [Pedobacter sp. VNH31]MEE1884263.1 DUF5687 family protein [Pedobacter sp. VNH31]